MRSERRLPEDPAYWDELAARSIDGAFSSAHAHAHGGALSQPWWRGMSDAAFVLAASAVLAVAGGALLPERSPLPRAPTEASALTGALAPDDPLLASLLSVSAEAPPSSVLLKLIALREETR